MALWIDRDWAGLADLTAIDSDVPSIAEAEGIDTEGAGGVVREAFAECSNWLTTSFPTLSRAFDPVTDAGRTVSNHFRLEQVVMTEQYGERRTPLRDWLIWSTLAAFYRSAVRRALNDRYERKLELAEVEVSKRLATVRRAGIPIVTNPLPCPGAILAPWATVAVPISASLVSGVGAARTIYWAASYSAGAVESAISDVQSIDVGAGQSALAAASAPPFSVSGYAQPLTWNCYVGSSPNVLRLIAGGLTLFVSTDIGGTASGAFPANGQTADTVVPYRDLILRG